MTTDDKEKEIINGKDDNAATSDTSDKVTETLDQNKDISSEQQAVINAMMEKFNSTLDETMKKYDKKIEELNTSITKKDEEIAKLRKVNSEILMSSDFRANKDVEVDFNDADFNDVDWDKEAKALFTKIDKKIA